MFSQEYKSLTSKPECPEQVWVYLACALFFLGLYKEAEDAASKGRLSRVHCTFLQPLDLHFEQFC